MLTSGRIVLCADSRILLEYDDVLRRPRFDFDPGKVDIVLAYILGTVELHPTIPHGKPLPDPDDLPFLEVAAAAKVDCLVTGNIKHFPHHSRAGVRVASPADFIAIFRASEAERQNTVKKTQAGRKPLRNSRK